MDRERNYKGDGVGGEIVWGKGWTKVLYGQGGACWEQRVSQLVLTAEKERGEEQFDKGLSQKFIDAITLDVDWKNGQQIA